jgi:hypothetical protein
VNDETLEWCDIEHALLSLTQTLDLLTQDAASEEQRLSEAFESLMRIEMALSSLETLVSIRDVMIHPKDREVLVSFARLNATHSARQAQTSHQRVTRLLVNAWRPAVAMELVKARDIVAEVLSLLQECQ